MKFASSFPRAQVLLTVLLCLVSLGACQQDEHNADRVKANQQALSQQELGEQQHDHSQHVHGDLDVTSFGENTPIPTIDFAIEADSMSGWNIQITTNNFHFAPDKVNAGAAAGEGHAHIYVDGYKMARIYGNWYHLKKLTPGEHTVRVSLNANDHSNWSHNGRVISATQSVIQK